MTLLNSTQRTILSIALIIIFLILIYVLWLWIKKEFRHATQTKFNTLNAVIHHKNMKKLIQFNIHQGENHPFSLMMITIDHFDQILDFAEDRQTTEYIQRVGRLLEISLPLGAKLAQTEERETFIVYFPENYTKETLMTIAENFKDMAEKRIELSDGLHIEKSASVALITYPNDETKYDELMNGLDVTMYDIKKDGGNHIRTYSANMIEEKANIEAYQILKEAIKRHEIEPLFVPFYDRSTKFMIGVEIDLVWHKEDKDENYRSFMPNLEASNDSYWMGLWMLEKALASHISMIGINSRQLYEIMIPVGVRQFENPLISQDIMSVLEKYELQTEQLILKIINPLQVNHEADYIKSLMELQGYGVRLAVDVQKIDDQLYYRLNEYKIDVLLIDQSLLTKQHDKSIEMEELINYSIAQQIEMYATSMKSAEQVIKLDDHIVKIQGPFCCLPLTRDQLLNQLNKKLDI